MFTIVGNTAGLAIIGGCITFKLVNMEFIKILEQIYTLKGKNLNEVLQNLNKVGYKNANEQAQNDEFERHYYNVKELEKIAKEIDTNTSAEKVLFSILFLCVIEKKTINKEMIYKILSVLNV